MKLNVFTLVLLATVLGNLAIAKTNTPKEKSLILDRPSEAKVNELLRLKPKPAHHINIKAPNRCGKDKPTVLTPSELQCQFKEPGTYEITAAICDDPKTFCNIEKFDIKVSAPKNWNSKNPSQILTKSAQSGIKATKQLPPPGFIMNNPAHALFLARRSNQLLFIDFYGVWCPPCNLLKEQVYPIPEFQKKTKHFIKIALDADAEVSWPWKARFKVGGYPTIIIANHNLEEIGRIVGYRPMPALLKWIEEQEKLKEWPIRKVARQVNPKNPQAMLRVARWYLTMKEPRKARALLEQIETRSPEAKRELLELSLGEAKADAKQTAFFLKSLLEKYPDDLKVAGWTLRLIEAFPKKGKEYALKAIENLNRWKRPERKAALDESGYHTGDLEGLEGDLRAKLGEEEKSKAAYRKAAETYAAVAADSILKTSRGANLIQAYYWGKAEEWKKAIKLYEQLTETYKDEFTFHFGYARALNKTEDHRKALKQAKKARKFAYGDNWIRANLLIAKIELAREEPGRAKRVLESTLAEVTLPESPDIRTHRYVAQLRDLLEEVKTRKE